MDISQQAHKWEKIDIRFAAIPLLLLALCLYWARDALPIGLDWRDTYRPAALAMARGESPYSIPIYYAAPWGAALLIPFALLPYEIGRFLLFFVSLLAFAFIPIRLGTFQRYPLAAVLFLTSAAVVGCLNNGNIEFLPLLAIVCPPWLGLILIAIKPQVGLGLAIFWGIQIWRYKGPRAVLWSFLPVSLMLIGSFIIYGAWPLRFSQTLALSVDNTSFFPWSVPLGIILLYVGVYLNWNTTALAASPLLAPYVLQFTWSALLVECLDRPRLLFFAWVALWVPVILRVLF
jgi:hypothetical protein